MRCSGCEAEIVFDVKTVILGFHGIAGRTQRGACPLALVIAQSQSVAQGIGFYLMAGAQIGIAGLNIEVIGVAYGSTVEAYAARGFVAPASICRQLPVA